MKKKYPVVLTDHQRQHLQALVATSATPARMQTRTRVLLKADQSPDGSTSVDDTIAVADAR